MSSGSITTVTGFDLLEHRQGALAHPHSDHQDRNAITEVGLV
jgi:hypothetical protein